VQTETWLDEKPTREIRCAEIWGGIRATEQEVRTPGVSATLSSTAGGDDAGGDIYYFSVCQYESLTRIAIADVRGHGQAASEVSGWIYQALERRMNDPNGAKVLTELNQLASARGTEAITTAAVATFHRERRTLSYAYAGHPPMLLGRRGRNWRALDTAAWGGPSNTPLGAIRQARFTQATVRVEPGDRLFVATDGVRETPRGDEDFGDERLIETLERTAERPLADARRQVNDELERFAGGALVHDDCTFLLVEILEPPPTLWQRLWRGGTPGQPSR